MAQIETIHYQVVQDNGHLQIRKYDKVLLASTKTDPKNPNESGFQNVFEYISGDNDKQTNISMTSPVISYQEDDKVVTGFYVPSKYNKETVPQPASEKVFLKELPFTLLGVVRFNGYLTKESYLKHEQILRDYIEKSDYRIVSKPYRMGYDAPYVPAEQRRNEIAYQIEQRKED